MAGAEVGGEKPGRETLHMHRQRAWQWFQHTLGAPQFWCAPMVDASEYAFRTLVARHGADGAYSPMLHPAPFCASAAYRSQQLTTDDWEKHLFVQFCACPSEVETLAKAASIAEKHYDIAAVDLNLGCPQKIARKGNFGAFLMDDMQSVNQLVQALEQSLETVPATVKIRCFDDVSKTVQYARMLENAGASLIAVHGRTRQETNSKSIRADWEQIRAVKESVGVPVLGNGDVRCRPDAKALMSYTGADGVLSAEPLLRNPALFQSDAPVDAMHPTNGCTLAAELVRIAREKPMHQPARFVRDHVFKLLGSWLEEFTYARSRLANCHSNDFNELLSIIQHVHARIDAVIASECRTNPIPTKSARQLEREQREQRKQEAIKEQKEFEDWKELLGVV